MHNLMFQFQFTVYNYDPDVILVCFLASNWRKT